MTRTRLATSLRALRRRLLRAAERLGAAGVVGAALLAACAGYYGGSMRPLAQQVAALEAARSEGRAPVRRASTDDRGEQLRRFATEFPEEGEVAALLARLYGMGERAGVRLAQGEYRFHEPDALGMVQYKVVLPVSGTYPRIRQFVGTVLAEAPWVAITQLNLQRERVGQGQVEARLELTLHLRARTNVAAANDTAETQPLSVAAQEAR